MVGRVLPALSLLLAVLAVAAPVSNASAVRTIDLPYGYIPIGVVIYGGAVWTASYTFGAVSRIDFASGNVTHYFIEGAPDTDYEWQFYGLTVDGDGNFWIASRVGKLVFFNTTDCTFAVKLEGLAGLNSVHYFGGKVWFAASGRLYAYDVAFDNYTYYEFGEGPTPGSYYGVTHDPEGRIWFADVVNGVVYVFNGTHFRAFTGLHRPLSIAFADGYAYIAENVRAGDPWTPAIAVLDPSSGAVSRVAVAGSPYGILAFKVFGVTTIVYSSSGEDVNRTRGVGFIVGGSRYFVNVNVPAVYHLAYEPSADAVYFTYYGSGSGVGVLSGTTPQVVLLPSEDSVNVVVNEAPPTQVVFTTVLELTVDRPTAFAGDSVTFTAVLKYGNGTYAGQPVGAGKPIKLYVNGSLVAQGVTDDGGSWSYTMVFSEPGTYVVKAVFEGGSFSPYYSASSSSEVAVRVLPHEGPAWAPIAFVAAVAVSALVVVVFVVLALRKGRRK